MTILETKTVYAQRRDDANMVVQLCIMIEQLGAHIERLEAQIKRKEEQDAIDEADQKPA